MRLTGLMTRRLAATLVTAAVTLSSVAGAVATTPAPRPPELPALAGENLDGIYDDNLEYIEAAAAMAEVDGNHERANALRSMGQPDRRFLSFDARAAGRVVEVIGDLERAEKVSIVVPGSDVSIDTFEGESTSSALGASARTLYERSSELSGKRIAVIAWLGYETPDTFSLAAMTHDRAEEGAEELSAFVVALQRVTDAPVALMCHSYGSVVCGLASAGVGEDEPGLEVSDIVVFGSPGMGVESADDLAGEARLWAGRGTGDWISAVPNESFSMLGTTVGFGDEPTDPSFGALPLNAGDGGHSDYLQPGSPALDSLARIASGDAARVVAGG
jgi:Alpha/beta hydrolase